MSDDVPFTVCEIGEVRRAKDILLLARTAVYHVFNDTGFGDHHVMAQTERGHAYPEVSQHDLVIVLATDRTQFLAYVSSHDKVGWTYACLLDPVPS